MSDADGARRKQWAAATLRGRVHRTFGNEPTSRHKRSRGIIGAVGHRRESHVAAHEADAHQLNAIEAVLDGRIHKAIARSVADPPPYITKSLGRRPGRGRPDREWVRTVATVERYRVEHDVTDNRTLIGPYPEQKLNDQLTWELVHRSVAECREDLGIEPSRAARRSGIEPPSIGL